MSNKTVFLNDLQLKFQQTDPNYLQKLVESMPRRLETVIRSRGYNTKY